MTTPDTPGPDVSVLVAAWKAETTLPRAVRSAVAQDGVSVEVLVVDDASPDGTLACAKHLAMEHPNLIVRSMPRNGGPSVARNCALDLATGRYVTVLDSDDMMEPGRLRALVALADGADADAVADDLLRVDEDDPEGPRRRLLTEEEIGWRQIDLTDFILGNLTTANGSRGEMGFLKPLMRRSFLTEHALRYDETMRLGEDYLLYAQMLGHGARIFLTDPKGYLAIMRPDSLSGRHSARDLGALVAADLSLRKDFALTDAAAQALDRHLIDTKKRWQWMRLIEAVKARDVRAALRCFADHPKVGLFLVSQLWEQVLLRTRRKIGQT
ncbi:MAG: glycosyltransferase family 2 protein [Pseudomonadota bacterium]